MTGDDWFALAVLAWACAHRHGFQAMYSEDGSGDRSRAAAVAARKVAESYDERAAAGRDAG